MNTGARPLRVHVGPTARQYKRAHPEVDWSRHEVLYRVLQTRRRDRPMVTTIDSHHVTPDYRAIHDAMDESDGLPRGTQARLVWEENRCRLREGQDDDDF